MWDVRNNAYSCSAFSPRSMSAPITRTQAGPGGRNDPDMLVVGMKNTGNIKGGGCTVAEYQTQMSMWCVLAAPLMIGCDIRKMDADTKRILTNPEVIAVDQDSLGKQGNRVARTGSTDVWQKPLSGGKIAVALLNRGEKPAEITVQWNDLKAEPSAVLAARDLWAHKDLGKFTDHLTLTVEPHATVLIKLQPLVQQAKN